MAVTEVFDDFNIDSDDEKDATFKRILAKAQSGTDTQSCGMPPMSLILELKGKLEERKTKIVDQEPTAFKVFDKKKNKFVSTSKDERAQQLAKHEREMAVVRKK